MLARQQAFDFGLRDHYQTLHGGHHSAVAVATRSAAGAFQQHVYSHDDALAVLANLAGADDMNTYLSQSGFATPGGRRTIAQVQALTSWWVDLDHYKLPDLAALDAERLLELALAKHPWLPLPTLLVDSGRGAYLVWAFDKPVPKDRLADWQAVEDVLVTILADIGADKAARDAARILRVVGSLHLVAGERVTARRVGDAVSFERMRQLVIEQAPVLAPVKTTTGYQQPVLRRIDGDGVPKIRRGTSLRPYQLALDRMSDFRRLAELRGGKLTDYRHRLLYCYAQACCWFSGSLAQLQDELREFSETYFAGGDRYGPRQVQTVIDRFVDDGYGKIVRLATTRDAGRYRFSNRYIISLLKITADEQRELGTIISNTEKLRRLTEKRRATGMMSREQYRDRAADRRQEARRLRSDGMTVADIAEQLGVAHRTIYAFLRAG